MKTPVIARRSLQRIRGLLTILYGSSLLWWSVRDLLRYMSLPTMSTLTSCNEGQIEGYLPISPIATLAYSFMSGVISKAVQDKCTNNYGGSMSRVLLFKL